MAESKEEKLRLWREYDNEPYLPGYTRGEFNRLPCRGFLSEKQYSGEPRWHDAFPPCVGPRGARQPEVLAAFPAALGYPPEEDDGPKYNGRASNRPAEEDGEAS